MAAGLEAAPLAVCRPVAALPHDLNDRGIFEIFSAGKNIGTEEFEIRVRGSQIEARGNVHLQVERNGKAAEVRTASSLVLDGDLDPISYTWSQKGAQSSQLSVDFRSQPVHARYKAVNGQEDRRDFSLAKDVLVLDDNCVHHYELAIARYEAKGGGQQPFHAFIPQEAAPGVITVESTGAGPVTLNGTTQTLHRILLTADLAKVTVWVDDQGHVQKVSAPEAQFEATRKR